MAHPMRQDPRGHQERSSAPRSRVPHRWDFGEAHPTWRPSTPLTPATFALRSQLHHDGGGCEQQKHRNVPWGGGEGGNAAPSCRDSLHIGVEGGREEDPPPPQPELPPLPRAARPRAPPAKFRQIYFNTRPTAGGGRSKGSRSRRGGGGGSAPHSPPAFGLPAPRRPSFGVEAVRRGAGDQRGLKGEWGGGWGGEGHPQGVP